MTLNIGTWNSDGQIGTAEGTEALATWLREDQLDAVVLQHCLPNELTQEYVDLRARLGSMGYRLALFPYGDTDGRLDWYNLGMAVSEDRLIGDIALQRLGKDEDERAAGMGRAALRCALRDQILRHDGSVEDITVEVHGIHFDDRSEETRLGQQESLLRSMDASLRPIVAGDRNATYGTGVTDEGFRILGRIFGGVRPADPGRPVPPKYSLAWLRWAPHRLASVFQRLREMSSGVVMDTFTLNGFRDADSDHRTTMYRPIGTFGVPTAQVDGVLVGDGLEATAERRPRVSNGRHSRVVAHITALPLWPRQNQ